MQSIPSKLINRNGSEASSEHAQQPTNIEIPTRAAPTRDTSASALVHDSLHQAQQSHSSLDDGQRKQLEEEQGVAPVAAQSSSEADINNKLNVSLSELLLLHAQFDALEKESHQLRHNNDVLRRQLATVLQDSIIMNKQLVTLLGDEKRRLEQRSKRTNDGRYAAVLAKIEAELEAVLSRVDRLVATQKRLNMQPLPQRRSQTTPRTSTTTTPTATAADAAGGVQETEQRQQQQQQVQQRQSYSQSIFHAFACILFILWRLISSPFIWLFNDDVGRIANVDDDDDVDGDEENNEINNTNNNNNNSDDDDEAEEEEADDEDEQDRPGTHLMPSFLTGLDVAQFSYLFDFVLMNKSTDDEEATMDALFSVIEDAFARNPSSHGISNVLKYAIQKEVDSNDHPSTVFRKNGFPSKLVISYLKKHGGQYLNDLVTPFLQEHIWNRNDSFEVEPERVKRELQLQGIGFGGDGDNHIDSDKLEELVQQKVVDNMKKLLDVSGAFMERLFDSAPRIPVEFGLVFYHLRTAIQDRFGCDGAIQQLDRYVASCCGGLILLRFINPAIIQSVPPQMNDNGNDGSNTDRRRASQQQQQKHHHLRVHERNQLLVAKMLQGVSNAISSSNPEQHLSFISPRGPLSARLQEMVNGPNGPNRRGSLLKREAYLYPANQFVLKNTKLLQSFLMTLTVPPMATLKRAKEPVNASHVYGHLTALLLKNRSALTTLVQRLKEISSNSNSNSSNNNNSANGTTTGIRTSSSNYLFEVFSLALEGPTIDLVAQTASQALDVIAAEEEAAAARAQRKRGSKK